MSEIVPSEPSTWRGRIFVTLDLDFASDEVIGHAVDLVESHGCPATWFVTHPTPLLGRLRRNPRFELGIHPDFHALLMGRRRTTPQAILAELMRLVPEARSVRSHMLVQSSALSRLFRRVGLRFECNDFVSAEAGARAVPWRHWSGLVRVAASWEDDVAILCGWQRPLSEYLDREGMHVFTFHPLHLAADTRGRAQLERTFEVYTGSLAEVAATGSRRGVAEGTRARLVELLGEARRP